MKTKLNPTTAKVIVWIVAPIVGLLAGVAFSHFAWGTPLRDSIFSGLSGAFVLAIIMGFIYGGDVRKKSQQA